MPGSSGTVGRSGIEGRSGRFGTVSVGRLTEPGVVPVEPVDLRVVFEPVEPGTDGVDTEPGPFDWTSFEPAVSAALAQPASAPIVSAPRAAVAASRFTRLLPVIVGSTPSCRPGRRRSEHAGRDCRSAGSPGRGCLRGVSGPSPLVGGAVGHAPGGQDRVVG